LKNRDKPLSALILGAGREPPNADGRIPLPRCLLTDPFGSRVMDWILAALKSVDIDRTLFVGGYQIEEVGLRYPDLSFIYNPEWETSGVLGSLDKARNELHGELLISYADIVYSPRACHRLLESRGHSITIAIDGTWRCPDQASTTEPSLHKNLVVVRDGKVSEIGFLAASPSITGEFIGLAHFDESVVPALKSFFEKEYSSWHDRRFQQAEDISHGYLTDLLRHLMAQGFEINCVDIGSEWAEMEEPGTFARFVIGTKSDTLSRLAHVVTSGKFCEQHIITVQEWDEQSEACLKKIEKVFSPRRIVIRSSALMEDSWEDSFAGAFDSVLNIDSADPVAVSDGIERVIASYGSTSGGRRSDDQVLIQEQVNDVVLSGVVLTRDLETGAPYYTINYDDKSSRTDGVTSGMSGDTRTTIVSRRYLDRLEQPVLRDVLSVINEIENVTGCKSLDVEFAVDKQGDVFVLQVRPIAAGLDVDPFSEVELFDELSRAYDFLEEKFRPAPGLLGCTTVLADMPDWNPAEMIGTQPRPLASSLYNYLIMDSAWRVARARMGYQNPEPYSLMTCIGGHPYVDVRCSFNNLLPTGLNSELSEKLVNYYLNELVEDTSKHDKVEFEICLTCLDFDFEARSQKLLSGGFSADEIRTLEIALREITDRNICEHDVLFGELNASLETLKARTDKWLAGADTPDGILRAVGCILDDIIEFGTIPFSIFARCGFIANSLLRSLVSRGAFTEEDQYAFLGTIDTVASQMVGDIDAVRCGSLSLEKFIEVYGHLRPGTYEITSLRYDEAPEAYFKKNDGDAPQPDAAQQHGASAGFEMGPDQRSRVGALLKEAGLTFSVDQLMSFIRRSVALREYGKFEFTRALSEVLRQLDRFGELCGVTRSDMSFISIYRLKPLSWNVEPYGFKKQLEQDAECGRSTFNRARLLKLPHILIRPEDAFVFESLRSRPNFVTVKQVTAPIIRVMPDTSGADLRGRILLIEGADPGYDWIFAHGILGLITKYGGAASHMTIRAAEFGIPAAIGCGDRLFAEVAAARSVELNCATRQIHVV
jgi:glutamine kinase